MIITASELVTLKNKINAEVTRRNATGAISQKVTVTPTAGNKITASDYNNFAAPLIEANKLIVTAAAGNYIVDDTTILNTGMAGWPYLQNLCARLESYTTKTGLSTGCQASCTGLCSSGCTNGCSGCGSGCSTDCSGSCSGGCQDNCSTGCSGACWGECTGCGMSDGTPCG